MAIAANIAPISNNPVNLWSNLEIIPIGSFSDLLQFVVPIPMLVQAVIEPLGFPGPDRGSSIRSELLFLDLKTQLEHR